MRGVETGAGRPAPASPPVAAVDCGTNTVRLLIAAGDEQLVRETRVVRLGQGVDATGRLTDEALARTFAAIEDYADLVAAHGVVAERIRFCATSATRDADNAETFRRGVLQRLGVEPEVLSGEEEANLAFAGAMLGLGGDQPMPLLVLDVGGGSTEVVLGDRDGVRAARSMDVGAVRLTERHAHHDPMTEEEVAAVVAAVDAHLAACGLPLAEAATVVGVAGTCTTLAAAVLDLPGYDPAAIHGSQHALDDVREAIERIVAMTVAERRALPFLNPGRADVIGAGLLIVQQVLRHTRVAEFVVSESDILDGIAVSLR